MNTPMTLPETLEKTATTLSTGEKITLNEFLRHQREGDSTEAEKIVYVNVRTGAAVFDEPTKGISPNSFWLVISHFDSLLETKDYLNRLFSGGRTLTPLGEADPAEEWEAALVLRRPNKVSEGRAIQAVVTAFRVRTNRIESV